MYAPTILSPNGDEVNDRRRIHSSEQKAELVFLNIIDRWGGILFSYAIRLLYESALEWDGRMMWRELGGGVYVFVAVIKTGDGVIRHRKGDITLIR